VPTLKERAGDFSGLPATIVDPFTKDPLSRKRHSGEPDQSGRRRAGRPVSAPNNADPSRNYIGHPKGRSDNDVVSARVDYQPGKARHHLGPRHVEQSIRSRRRTGTVAGISRIRSGTVRQQPAVGLGKVHIFSPTLVNEVNVGLVRFRRERRSVDAFTRDWVRELGIRGISPEPLTWAAPSMTPAGYSEIGYSSNNAIFRWVT
jgi:hypothetical protein